MDRSASSSTVTCVSIPGVLEYDTEDIVHFFFNILVHFRVILICHSSPCPVIMVGLMAKWNSEASLVKLMKKKPRAHSMEDLSHRFWTWWRYSREFWIYLARFSSQSCRFLDPWASPPHWLLPKKTKHICLFPYFVNLPSLRADNTKSLFTILAKLTAYKLRAMMISILIRST